MSNQNLLLGALTLATLPLVAAVVAIALIWCVHQWNWPLWVAMLVGGGSFVGLTHVIWRSALKLVQRRFQFGIRALLFRVAAIAVLLSTLGRWWLTFSKQFVAIQSVNSYGGYVEDPRTYRGRPRNLLYSSLGFDPFSKEQELWIPNDRALADVLERPDQFTDFVQLSFQRGVTSAVFERAEQLNQLRNVEFGEFMMSAIDDTGTERLSHWTNLRGLFFNGCKSVTDAGFAHFAEMPILEELSLVEEGNGMVITDAGLVHIGKLQNLRFLMLIGMPNITDAGLVQLHCLSNLENLVIHRTGITEQGIKQLQEALPDCRISSETKVSGPRNVRCIRLRRLGKSEGAIRDIKDSARIADVLDFIDNLTEQALWGRLDEPSPADLELDFVGQSRVLYQVRVGDGAIQQNYRTRWNSWQITKDQRSQLLNLLDVGPTK